MPAVISTTPENLQVDVPLNVYFKIKFDTDIDADSVSENTLILAESNTEEIVQGVPGYVYGTRTITFQLFEYLKKNTEYTFILVGGTEGIKDTTGRQVLDEDYIIRFRTGDNIDSDLALAKEEGFDGTQPFKGEDGIYQQVYERTGEPISHIVTTAGTVGPSGDIIPQAAGADTYLPPEEQSILVVEDVNLDYEERDVTTNEVIVEFSEDLESVNSEDIYIEYQNMFNDSSFSEVDNYSFEFSGNEIIINFDDLFPTSKYVLKIKSSVQSITGSSMVDDFDFIFYSYIEPFYTTVRTIRSYLGSLINEVSDFDIRHLIYRHSSYLQDKFGISGNPSKSAVDYVVCAVQLDLVKRSTFEGGPARSKRLDVFQVDYSDSYSDDISDFIEDLEDCVNSNLVDLGGDSNRMETVVRAKNDPRRPVWRRLENDGSFK